MVNKKKPKLKYFYLDGELHKVLKIIRAENLAICWNYPQHKRVGYVWSDARKRLGKAFTMMQVSEMIGRHRVNIERDILAGNIRKPQRAYAISGSRRPPPYIFSEENVMELHDYLLSVHIGRPRADGKITPRNMPSKAELRAMMRHDVVMYVKSDNGTFTPVWKEQDW